MNYYPKIDGLRFVAIFLVLLEHFAIFIGRPISAGYYGVDFFFTISGFLVTGILLNENKSDFKGSYIRFLGRRTLRIFPIYYLTLAILWLLNFDIVRDNIKYLATYTFNYIIILKDLPNNPINPYWSLCVEEQFYLFWPIVVLGLKKNMLLLLLMTVVIIGVAYFQLIFQIFPVMSKFNYYGLLTRMGSLGLGALGAILARKDLLPGRLLVNKRFEYSMLIVLVFALITHLKFQMIILPICSLYMVLKAAYFGFNIQTVDKFLTNKNVIWIGRISYGIYVFHMPIAYYFDILIFDKLWNNFDFESLGRFAKVEWHPWIVKFPLYSFLSILIAAVSYKYIEKPILSFKNNLK